MSKIFCIMGKSSSGKDTLYKLILADNELNLKKIVPFTTRPIRSGEKDGREYYFVDKVRLKELIDADKIIERREYQTVYGIWSYFTADDGQIELSQNDYLLIGTLETYEKMLVHFGKDAVIPIYVEVDDGLRLQRALDREKLQQQPKYSEMCRRFLADGEDFSEEKLKRAGILRKFYNKTLDKTEKDIIEYIKQYQT